GSAAAGAAVSGPVASPNRIAAAQRPTCVSCERPYGRRRPQMVDGEPLIVSDQCWRLAGGAAAVERRLAAATPEPALVVDPAAELVLARDAGASDLHPLDRMLVESGLRWTVLRQVIPAARVDLALQVVS